jgi:putative tricarboxylic transport membrane protein
VQASRNTPELLLGLGIVCLGVFICTEAAGIRVSPAYAKVGPAVFPWIIGGLLALAGALIGWQSLRAAPTPLPPIEYAGVAAIAAGLLLEILLFERAGFVASAIILFMLTAWGFGSRSYARDAIVAVILAVFVYFVFTRALGLKLPQGLIPL